MSKRAIRKRRHFRQPEPFGEAVRKGQWWRRSDLRNAIRDTLVKPTYAGG